MNRNKLPTSLLLSETVLKELKAPIGLKSELQRHIAAQRMTDSTKKRIRTILSISTTREVHANDPGEGLELRLQPIPDSLLRRRRSPQRS